MSTDERVIRLLSGDGPSEPLDLSSANLDGADLSGKHFHSCNFANCSFRNTDFRNAVFIACDFSGSDWHSANFRGASFNTGNFYLIKNAPRAKNLDQVTVGPSETHFDKLQLKFVDQYLDWEKIGALGRLPFLSASTITLVVLSVYFYFHQLFNSKIEEFVILAKLHPNELNSFGALISRLHIPIPSMAFLSFLSAVCLLIASLVYEVYCPKKVKEFSSQKWQFEMKRSLLEFFPHSWNFRIARIVSAVFYAVGGMLAFWILVVRTWDIAAYLLLQL